MPIPQQLAAAKYISLTTFKKDGTAVRTPVWFAESEGKLYFMTRNDMWKYKRIRNNPRVSVAPCSMRGTVTGPEFAGQARIPAGERLGCSAKGPPAEVLAIPSAVLEPPE